MPLNFNTKCRSCLVDDHEMHYLFKEFDQGLNLSDILRSTTNLEIEENDGLSPYLCESCTAIVVDFFNFKAIYLENINYVKSICTEKNITENQNEIKIECDIETNGTSNREKFENNQIIQINSIQANLNEGEELNIIGEFIEPKSIITDVKPDENVEIFKSVKYSCEECGECFSLKASFTQHMFKSHNISVDDIKKYVSKTTVQVPKVENLKIQDENIFLQCDICDENFLTYFEIEKHYKTHKKYVCEHCGAGFLKKSYLNDHAEIHTTEKRHVCHICGKAFRRRTVLVKHKKIHTHPKQCVCEICGLRFTDKGTLKTHIKLKHTKERNFNCTICGLWFPLKSTLMKHVYRHNEGRKREHLCEVCHMAYKDKSSLNRHVQIKHTENAAKPSCSLCGKQYTTNTNLLKHLRKNHKSVEFTTELRDTGEEFDKC